MYDAGAEEQFSQMGRYFVGGLLQHMSALVALTCPSYNSYRRLQPRSWSTSDVVWGFDNRQAAVRAASPFWGREMETANIEIKASDSTSNPYIALAGMIAAGLDGIDNKIDPGEPTQVDPADYADGERERRGIRRVPTSLREAIGALKVDPLFKELMPELMWRAYQAVKLAECDQSPLRRVLRLDLNAIPWPSGSRGNRPCVYPRHRPTTMRIAFRSL
jgi:glutamine synthetase